MTIIIAQPFMNKKHIQRQPADDLDIKQAYYPCGLLIQYLDSISIYDSSF